MRVLSIICFALMIMLVSHAYEVSHAHQGKVRAGAPKPQLGLEEARLASLYEYTIKNLRDLSAEADKDATHLLNRPGVLDYSQEDVDYVFRTMEAALEEQPPDFDVYLAGLAVARAAAPSDARLVSLAQKLFSIKRGEEEGAKKRDVHGAALIDTVGALGYVDSEQSADLLLEATGREFWGPIFGSRFVGTHPEPTVVLLRLRSVRALSLMPAELSLPRLEILQEQYPDKGGSYMAPADDYVFEEGAGRAIRVYIWEVKDRAGMDAGLHPSRSRRGDQDYSDAESRGALVSK